MGVQIGVITEQNDLGLGFDPINEKDQKIYQEHVQNVGQKPDKGNNQQKPATNKR